MRITKLHNLVLETWSFTEMEVDTLRPGRGPRPNFCNPQNKKMTEKVSQNETVRKTKIQNLEVDCLTSFSQSGFDVQHEEVTPCIWCGWKRHNIFMMTHLWTWIVCDFLKTHNQSGGLGWCAVLFFLSWTVLIKSPDTFFQKKAGVSSTLNHTSQQSLSPEQHRTLSVMCTLILLWNNTA